jgi:hypothetical protein
MASPLHGRVRDNGNCAPYDTRTRPWPPTVKSAVTAAPKKWGAMGQCGSLGASFL